MLLFVNQAVLFLTNFILINPFRPVHLRNLY